MASWLFKNELGFILYGFWFGEKTTAAMHSKCHITFNMYGNGASLAPLWEIEKQQSSGFC